MQKLKEMVQKLKEMVEANMNSWVGKDEILVQTKGVAKESNFYVVNLRDDKVTKLRCGFLWNHNMRNGLIVDGSVIYAIGDPDHFLNRGYPEKPDDDDGDDYHIHTGASFLDLKVPGGSWKGLGGMMLNCYRSYPACASLDGNIFVFGAKGGTSLSTFGEFYDKKNGSWKPIPIPKRIDHQMNITRPIVSDKENRRILVYFSLLSSLYAYYPDNNHQWVCLDDNMYWRGEPAPSPVDDVLYFIISYTDYENCIEAYDIRTKEFLEISWVSSCSSPFGPKIITETDFAQLLVLGADILCLTTVDDSHPATGISFWEFYRFQVCRVSQKRVLLTPLSVHRLPIEGREQQLNAITL